MPLEKSKTFRSRKEKVKGGRKGEAEQQGARHHGDGAGPRGADPLPHPHPHPHPHAPPATALESDEPRMHQPKLADIMRGRLASANAASVKQYGFVDSFASGGNAQEDVCLDPVPRTGGSSVVVGKDGRGERPLSHPYHSLPHRPHGHGSGAPHHSTGGGGGHHRRQFSHGDKPPPPPPPQHGGNPPPPPPPTAPRPNKNKPRPLSGGGPVVEPGRDPVDPVAALPQNSVARRRVKTLHMKKGRLSYPDGVGATLADTKRVNCLDLGFVEPGQDSVRGTTLGPGLGLDPDPLPIPAKQRRGVDRGCDRVGLGCAPSGFLEGQMSSYV